MAGSGERFKNYSTLPKPLIQVDGMPMFQFAEKNIGIEFDERIFIVRKEDDIADFVRSVYPEAKVIELDAKTEGTACTLLTAREHFDDGSSIFIANCDQYVDWDSKKFLGLVKSGVDGIIATFKEPGRSPKWSYAQTDTDGNVIRVAEKDPISDIATVGYYYFKDGGDFITAAENMIAADDRVNNEFYTCPVYNYYLKLNKKVITYNVDSMVGVGTPEDLINYNLRNLFDIDSNCAVCVSGGADSALMLYKVLQNNNKHTHVFTYANNTLMLKNVTASTAVVNKCVELTGNHNVTHHVIHNQGDKPNGVNPLIDMVEKYKNMLKINNLYLGVTKNPPSSISNNFKYADWKDPTRDTVEDNNIHTDEVFEKIITPWINIDKKQLALLYKQEDLLDTLFPVTYSCEWYPRDGTDPGMDHCGECWWCEERQWGFGRLV